MMVDEALKRKEPVGLNLYNFEVMDPIKMGVLDNYCVKKLFLTLTTTLSE